MECYLDLDSMKKLKAITEKCAAELTEKPSHTPAETKALKDGLEVIAMLEDKIAECEMEKNGGGKGDMGGMEYAERGYSRGGHPYRQYHITSYGQPIRMPTYHYGDGSYGMNPNMNGYSGDYGVQGWYRSGDGMPNCGPDPYYYGPEYSDRGHGYSRHSIGDRAVESLEMLMDKAGSEYEKDELRRFIQLIRSHADTK